MSVFTGVVTTAAVVVVEGEIDSVESGVADTDTIEVGAVVTGAVVVDELVFDVVSLAVGISTDAGTATVEFTV